MMAMHRFDYWFHVDISYISLLNETMLLWFSFRILRIKNVFCNLNYTESYQTLYWQMKWMNCSISFLPSLIDSTSMRWCKEIYMHLSESLQTYNITPYALGAIYVWMTFKSIHWLCCGMLENIYKKPLKQ